MRLLLALAAGFARATASIHTPRFWRLLYALLRRPAAIAVAAGLVRLVRRLRGEDAAGFLLRGLSDTFGWSGWPHQARGWVNLDASRFLSRVRRRARGDGAQLHGRRPPRPQMDVLRVGCVAPFANLVTFSREHLADTPTEVEVHAFDVADPRPAAYLDGAVAGYASFEPGPDRPIRIARAVTEAQLDLLLVVPRTRDLVDVVRAVDTPCVAVACTGSDLLHHDLVDFHLYPQPEADYFPRDGRLFCGTTRAWFGEERVVPSFFLYDARGLDPADRVPWRERDPLVVLHGSLYKTASRPFLEALFAVVRAHDDVEVVVLGRGTDDQVAFILETARSAGVGDRVRYEGDFSPLRGAAGELDDPGWTRLKGFLQRARLAPDPWPMGGAAARVEAYGAGVPGVHLAVRFDEASWGRRQSSIAEVEALRVERGVATTVEEYVALCERCLTDEAFAEALVADQAAVWSDVTSGKAYWRQLLHAYQAWRGESGAAATLASS